MALLAQLTDTHVVAKRSTGDTTSYLADALRALDGLETRPDAIVVTGDLVDRPDPAAYARFAETMVSASAPWFAIPGNHDDRRLMQRHLPPESIGTIVDGRATVDALVAGMRVIALDVTRDPHPGGALEPSALARLAALLDEAPVTPTVIAMHQPPYAALRVLDLLRFPGAPDFSELVARSSQVGRVICGHVHCVTHAPIGGALAMTAPSTAPQRIPEIFEPGLRIRRERAGFATHAYDPARGGWSSVVYRRDDDGRYELA